MNDQRKDSPEVLVMIIVDTDSRFVIEFLAKLMLDYLPYRASLLLISKCIKGRK